jgi:hypothetical protein
MTAAMTRRIADIAAPSRMPHARIRTTAVAIAISRAETSARPRPEARSPDSKSIPSAIPPVR